MSNKKVLLITLYYEPYNVIASQRTKKWFEIFEKKGIKLTVLTRHFKDDAKDRSHFHDTVLMSTAHEQKGIHEIYRVPFENKYELLCQTSLLFKNKLTRWPLLLYYLISGKYDTYNSNNDHFKNFLKEHLKTHFYDIVILFPQPAGLLELGYWIHKHYRIPYILDFRDYFFMEEMKHEPTIPFSQAVMFKILKRRYRKWLTMPKYIVSVSEGIEKKLKELTQVPQMVIHNGFEEDVLRLEPARDKSHFEITILGTLYPEQDLQLMIKGFNLFIEKSFAKRIRINFIGLSHVHSVVEYLKTNIDPEYLNITHRIPREDALSIAINSQVLYYPGWKGYFGIYSGKIFEYIACGINVLIAPNDYDVLEKLLEETKAGVCVDTADEMAAVLLQWQEEWVRTGTISYHGDMEKIKKYTRENQAAKYATLVGGLIREQG